MVTIATRLKVWKSPDIDPLCQQWPQRGWSRLLGRSSVFSERSSTKIGNPLRISVFYQFLFGLCCEDDFSWRLIIICNVSCFPRNLCVFACSTSEEGPPALQLSIYVLHILVHIRSKIRWNQVSCSSVNRCQTFPMIGFSLLRSQI